MYLRGSKKRKYEKVYMTSFLLILVTHLPNQRPEIENHPLNFVIYPSRVTFHM